MTLPQSRRPIHRVLVLGANGPSGRHTVQQALGRGLAVAALTRHPVTFPITHERLDVIGGDATEYVQAWMPEGAAREEYPARVSIAHSTVDERKTATIFEFEGDPDHVLDALGALVRPDWQDRVAALVRKTDVETIYVESLTFGSMAEPASSRR